MITIQKVQNYYVLILGNSGVFCHLLIPRSRKENPWESSLLKLVPEVKIQHMAALKLLNRPLRVDQSAKSLISTTRTSSLQQTRFPRVFFLEVRNKLMDKYPWVSEDGMYFVKNTLHKGLFCIINIAIRNHENMQLSI